MKPHTNCQVLDIIRDVRTIGDEIYELHNLKTMEIIVWITVLIMEDDVGI